MTVMEEPTPTIGHDCGICKQPRMAVVLASKNPLPEAVPTIIYLCARCDRGDE